MSIGVAVILAVGFVLGCAAIGLGAAICGGAKYAIEEQRNNYLMNWLRHDSIDWATKFAKATMEAYEDEE